MAENQPGIKCILGEAQGHAEAYQDGPLLLNKALTQARAYKSELRGTPVRKRTQKATVKVGGCRGGGKCGGQAAQEGR